ncbi:MAG: outer membrane protein assembly factor BamE [Gammaproteobacteria bacterium]|nr:outer membrane protein assembly factor BamE [Gammaproteobacteria bacterium]MDJ0892457.1 outer membrane protein assembly factor BamE [Gammaproteobacteria bacterium]
MQYLRCLTILLPSAALLMGCVQFSGNRGVEVTWDPDAISKLEKGKSTREDVLTLLGPPSQVIALENETVLYYLYERTEFGGVILILFNRLDRTTDYDRAVFFFNKDDVLIEYATRIKPDET